MVTEWTNRFNVRLNLKINTTRMVSILVLVLVVLSGFPAIATAQNTGERDKIFKIIDWTGYDLTTDLKDGTTLYSYVAETRSRFAADPNLDQASDQNAIGQQPIEKKPIEKQPIDDKAENNLVLRFTFLPRFQCSPLIEIIGMLPENTNAVTRVASVQNFNKLDFSIDGEQFQFPVIVEEQGEAIHSFMSANLQRRTSLRILVELGNESIVTFGDGTVTRFSLVGSQDTIAQALGRCRNHQ